MGFFYLPVKGFYLPKLFCKKSTIWGYRDNWVLVQFVEEYGIKVNTASTKNDLFISLFNVDEPKVAEVSLGGVTPY